MGCADKSLENREKYVYCVKFSAAEKEVECMKNNGEY